MNYYPKLIMPISALVLVTWRCNSKCLMCDIWRKDDSGNELTPAKFAELPRSLKDINITGGEPFLREDLTEIVRVIHKNCGHPTQVISTNGFLEERIEDFLQETTDIHRYLGIRVSIDGIGTSHNQVRGIKGGFEKAVNSIKIAKRLGLQNLGIGFTMFDYNVDQLIEVYALAKQLRVQFVLSEAHDSEISLKEQGNGDLKVKNIKRFKEAIAFVARDELVSFNPKNWYRSLYTEGVYNRSVTGKRNIPCGAGELFFWMAPNGDIYPDTILDWKFGNLRNNSFMEIWNSPEALRFREIIQPGSNNPKCNRHCWMSCTVAPYIRDNKFVLAPGILWKKLKIHLGGIQIP